MLYPSIDELVKKVESKYTLVTVASKRARHIRDNEKIHVENPRSRKFVGVALEEVLEGKVQYEPTRTGNK